MKGRNIFQTVKSKIIDTPDKNLKNIDIIVEEKATTKYFQVQELDLREVLLNFQYRKIIFRKRCKIIYYLRISEERLRGNFTVQNPNFNYSGKALLTDVFLTDTDKLTDSGYKSTDAGFSIGTGFEQYDDLYFRPTFRTTYEQLTTNSSASSNLKNKKDLILQQQSVTHLIQIKEIKDFKLPMVSDLNLLKLFQ